MDEWMLVIISLLAHELVPELRATVQVLSVLPAMAQPLAQHRSLLFQLQIPLSHPFLLRKALIAHHLQQIPQIPDCALQRVILRFESLVLVRQEQDLAEELLLETRVLQLGGTGVGREVVGGEEGVVEVGGRHCQRIINAHIAQRQTQPNSLINSDVISTLSELDVSWPHQQLPTPFPIPTLPIQHLPCIVDWGGVVGGMDDCGAWRCLLFSFILRSIAMGGCFGESTPQRTTTPTSILDLVRKIKLHSEQQQHKKAQLLRQQELILIQNFGKEKAERAQTMEQAIINRTVFTRNLILIYKILEMESKKVIDYKDAMQLNLDTVTSSVQVLIYSASILKQQLLFQLQAKVKATYPDFPYPLDQDIRHELIRHHKKTEQVTQRMENAYILEFSAQYNIDVNRICEAGHKYGYGQAP